MDLEYNTQVIILAVRNPLDVFISFFNMVATQSHSKTFSNDINEPNIAPFWDHFFESDVEQWFQWHTFWMDKIENSDIPIYFFRFEDLLLDPEPVLKEIF